MLKADDYKIDSRDVAGWPVNITSYRIGQTFYCHIDNVDPGATIARTQGATYDEAVQMALAKATERLLPKRIP